MEKFQIELCKILKRLNLHRSRPFLPAQNLQSKELSGKIFKDKDLVAGASPALHSQIF
jgi:hypothetical protein